MDLSRLISLAKSALFPSLIVVLTPLCLGVLNAVACDQMPGFMSNGQFDAPPSRPTVPLQFLPGELCSDKCEPGYLVRGVLDQPTEARIREIAAKTQQHLWLCFDSPGGHRDAALAKPLPANVSTCVADILDPGAAKPRSGLCASSCAWLWLSGQGRVLFGRNQIGFHRSYILDAPACVPGNAFKAVETRGMQWFKDWTQPAYSEAFKDARAAIRSDSFGYGAQEALWLDAQAVAQRGLAPSVKSVPAVFKVAATAQPAGM